MLIIFIRQKFGEKGVLFLANKVETHTLEFKVSLDWECCFHSHFQMTNTEPFPDTFLLYSRQQSTLHFISYHPTGCAEPGSPDETTRCWVSSWACRHSPGEPDSLLDRMWTLWSGRPASWPSLSKSPNQTLLSRCFHEFNAMLQVDTTTIRNLRTWPNTFSFGIP